MNTIHSNIILKGLKLHVHLGWPEEERVKPQEVLVDVNVNFAKPPQACISDTLEQTYCYAGFVTLIKEKTRVKKFRLLEHLTHEIYQSLKQAVTAETKISVRIKKSPPILNLKKGVIFYYGDEANTW